MTAPVTRRARKGKRGREDRHDGAGRPGDRAGRRSVHRVLHACRMDDGHAAHAQRCAVEFVEIPAEKMAALRFTGDHRPDTIAPTCSTVRAFEDTDSSPSGTPVTWFFDPPWTFPFLRHGFGDRRAVTAR